jgi:hypothetical protein
LPLYPLERSARHSQSCTLYGARRGVIESAESEIVIMDLLLIFFGALIVIFGFLLSAIPPLAIAVVIVGAAICVYGLILNHRSHTGR